MIAHPIAVAILDDDPSVRVALVRYLNSADMVAHAYETSDDLFGSLAQKSPDCLLVDLQGLKLGGLEVTKYLNHQGSRIPVIIITGSDDKSSLEDCMKEGVAGYLHKPLDPDHLIQAIEEVVGLRDRSGP